MRKTKGYGQKHKKRAAKAPEFEVGLFPTPSRFVVFETVEDQTAARWKAALVLALASFDIGGAVAGAADFRRGPGDERASVEAPGIKHVEQFAKL